MIKKIFICMLLFNSMIFAEVPQRAVSTAHFTTEILLALGAENQMVGTAYLDNPILPELKDAYDKVPVLSDKFPTKEQFYAVKPDFLTGWNGIVSPKNLGPKEELEKNGVQVYLLKTISDEKIEVLYQDILELGKIFNLEKNAKKIVRNMKNDIKVIKEKIPTTKKRVLAIDPNEQTPFVVGGKGIADYILKTVGAENVTKNLDKEWEYSTWENILMSNPEYIIFVDYGDNISENKIKSFINNSPLKNLKAVKERKYFSIALAGMSPGVRITSEMKNIAEKLHGIKF